MSVIGDSLRDIEVEQKLIGRAMYVDPPRFDEMSMAVAADDFWLPEHADLWRILLRRRASGQPIDTVSMSRALVAHHPRILESLGGLVGLTRLVDEIIGGMRWHHLATRLADLARRRRLRAAGAAIAEMATSDAPVGALASEAAQALYDANVAPPAEATSLSQALYDRFAEGSPVTRVQTGLSDLDEVFGGGIPPGYHVLAARTSEGKSSLMLSILHHMAIERGKRCVVASVEMDTQTLAVRMVAIRHRVNAFRLMALTHPTDRDVDLIAETSLKLSEAKIAIETRRLKIADVRWRAHQARREWGGLDVIFIDYLQRMKAEDRRAQRYQQVGDMSGECQRLAEEFGVPVIVLAQLSRVAADEKPQLHHLRESGDIEQDCDSAWLLSREGCVATLDIAKHRNGPLKEIKLEFVPSSMLFVDAVGRT